MKYLASILCLLTPCLAWSEVLGSLDADEHRQIKEIITEGKIIAQMGEARDQLLISHKKRLWLCEPKVHYKNDKPNFFHIYCTSAFYDEY